VKARRSVAGGPDAPGGLSSLERRIATYGFPRAIVAFSGGVDSSVVAAVAGRILGSGRVEAVTAVSPSYPRGELERARSVADSLGLVHRTVSTAEVERDEYARNDALRCFHCKTELYATLRSIASTTAGEGAVVLAGANADDEDDFRPGLRAAVKYGVRNPLLEEGMGKGAVRDVARRLGLSVADKPALACLSSRVAFGTPITPELLDRIDRAEMLVRSLGFDDVRVRHLPGDRASVEVAGGQVGRLVVHPDLPRLMTDIQGLGWANVEVDPRGYRPGSMNATLVQLQRGTLRRPPR
jgi:pyridinium-3,5-biscarboxylic acid mononucleotide sulfurtransferase